MEIPKNLQKTPSNRYTSTSKHSTPFKFPPSPQKAILNLSHHPTSEFSNNTPKNLPKNFRSYLETIKNPNQSNDSFNSSSSERLNSPRIAEILQKYSTPESRPKVRSVLSKQALIPNDKQNKRQTPTPEHSKLFKDSAINEKTGKKNASIQVFNIRTGYNKESFKADGEDPALLSKKLKEYEGIIRKQSQEIAHLKAKVGKGVENESKSLSPMNGGRKKHLNSYGDFWNLKKSALEPKSLYEMEGFRNLWICNIESKIINPHANQSKKFPSSLLYRYQNPRKLGKLNNFE